MWRTGFALELATVDEFPTFDAFLARAGKMRATETPEPGGVRRATFSSPEGTMTCLYDPSAERFISRAWNGREESTDHLIVEGGTPPRALVTPATLFGSEAMRAGK